MMRGGLLCFVFACASFGHAAAPATPLAVQDREHLSYRVSWAIVRGAGSIKIDARRDPTRADRLMVTTTTATRGLARMLMAFDAKAESLYDLSTGRLLSLHEYSKAKEREKEHSVVFDHAARQAAYKERGASESRPLPMPDGEPSDLILALLQTRTWNLKPGEARDALVLFGDDFYELTIHALRYEEIYTSLGQFKTLVLEPKMEKTPPKGMFKRGSSVRVWISQDEKRLPVRFEVEFNIGTGVATLDYYEPPGTANPAPTTPAALPAPDAKNSRP